MSRKAVLVLLGVCISFILLVVVSVSALVLYSLASHQETPEEKAREAKMLKRIEAKARVVYCLKDIPQGAIVDEKALEEREIELAKTPLDAVTSISLAKGRRAQYGMAQGQIVSQHDLAQ